MSSVPKITPEISINLQISFVKKKQLYALLRSLIADNTDYPDGLSMKTLTDRDNTLAIQLSSDRGFRKLISTVDELLEHIYVASQVISNA